MSILHLIFDNFFIVVIILSILFSIFSRQNREGTNERRRTGSPPVAAPPVEVPPIARRFPEAERPGMARDREALETAHSRQTAETTRRSETAHGPEWARGPETVHGSGTWSELGRGQRQTFPDWTDTNVQGREEPDSVTDTRLGAMRNEPQSAPATSRARSASAGRANYTSDFVPKRAVQGIMWAEVFGPPRSRNPYRPKNWR